MNSFRAYLLAKHGTVAGTLLDNGRHPRSYRDAVARRERKRPDGTPIWPLRDSDLSSRRAAA